MKYCNEKSGFVPFYRTTVVQIAEGADPQEVKRAVAEQHMKSMLVPVQLYVLEKLDQAIENGENSLKIFFPYLSTFSRQINPQFL